MFKIKKKKEKKKMENLKISSPWVSYLHKLRAMFDSDPAVDIVWNENDCEITLNVTGGDKADALRKLLPKEKNFGNIIVKTKVNQVKENWETPSLFQKAFEGNPIYADTLIVKPDGTSNPFCYVSFKKQVVQYWDDNLGDPFGRVSTLAQELAKEIFDQNGVYYTTEAE